jgi:hypothetical protein
MAQVEIGRRVPGAPLLILALTLALPAGVRAQSAAATVCARVPAGLRCAPLPKDGWVRREALQALDAEGRRRVGRGDYAGAAQAFGCLVEGDPTPESAGNLAVVLREQGDLGDALLVARCAENLAPPSPARDRARARREELELRLGLPASPGATAADAPQGAAGPLASAAQPATTAASALAVASGGGGVAPPGALDLRAPSESRAPASYRRAAYTTLAVGAAALIAGGVLYAFARDRAHQFDQEQQMTGYTDRARSLHSEAQNLEVAGWISAGAGAVAAAVGGVLLTF